MLRQPAGLSQSKRRQHRQWSRGSLHRPGRCRSRQVRGGLGCDFCDRRLAWTARAIRPHHLLPASKLRRNVGRIRVSRAQRVRVQRQLVHVSVGADARDRAQPQPVPLGRRGAPVRRPERDDGVQLRQQRHPAHVLQPCQELRPRVVRRLPDHGVGPCHQDASEHDRAWRVLCWELWRRRRGRDSRRDRRRAGPVRGLQQAGGRQLPDTGARQPGDGSDGESAGAVDHRGGAEPWPGLHPRGNQRPDPGQVLRCGGRKGGGGCGA
mmetsp:Transcript_2909/g.5844  ORF Transcript_2909/g.5844 Transcript_2909/m.5844 type:complete len:265 (+) Transcript_2909:570-1364(+)